MADSCMNRYGTLSCVECVGLPDVRVYEFYDKDRRMGTLFIEEGVPAYQSEANPKPSEMTRPQARILLHDTRTSGYTIRRVQ